MNLFGRFVVIGRLCLVQRFAVFVKPLLLSLQLLRRALLRGQHQMIRVGLCNALAALHRLGHAVIIRVQLFRGQHAAVFPNRRHLRHEAVFRCAVSGRQHGGNAARLGVVAPARRLHRFIAHLRAMGQIDVSAVFFAAELRLHGLAALLLVRLRRVVRGFSKKSAHKLRKPVSRFGQKAALFAFFGFLLPVIRFNRGIVSAGGRRRRPRNPLIGLVQRRRQLRFGVCAVFAFLDLLPRVQIVLCVLLLVRPITVKQALIVVRLLPVFALRQIRAFQKIPYAVRALAVKAAARRLGQRFVELLSLRAQIVVRNRVDAAHHRRRVGRVHVDALPVKPHQVQPRKFLHRVRACLRKRRFLDFVLPRLADGLRKQARAQQIFRAGEHRFAVLLAVFRPVLEKFRFRRFVVQRGGKIGRLFVALDRREIDADIVVARIRFRVARSHAVPRRHFRVIVRDNLRVRLFRRLLKRVCRVLGYDVVLRRLHRRRRVFGVIAPFDDSGFLLAHRLPRLFFLFSLSAQSQSCHILPSCALSRLTVCFGSAAAPVGIGDARRVARPLGVLFARRVGRAAGLLAARRLLTHRRRNRRQVVAVPFLALVFFQFLHLRRQLAGEVRVQPPLCLAVLLRRLRDLLLNLPALPRVLVRQLLHRLGQRVALVGQRLQRVAASAHAATERRRFDVRGALPVCRVLLVDGARQAGRKVFKFLLLAQLRGFIILPAFLQRRVELRPQQVFRKLVDFLVGHVAHQTAENLVHQVAVQQLFGCALAVAPALALAVLFAFAVRFRACIRLRDRRYPQRHVLTSLPARLNAF